MVTTFAHASQVKKRRAAEMMARKGVHGIGVSNLADGFVLCLYIDPQEAADIPAEIDGVTVTTVLSGPIRAL